MPDTTALQTALDALRGAIRIVPKCRRRAKRGLFRAALLGVAVAAAWVLCTSEHAGKPSVVLITLDTTRADRLGAMGYAQAQTPFLDSLAGRGAIFERAYASAPVTLPSHVTLLTGLDPNRHGVHDNGSFVAPQALDTVAERLKTRGYHTAAFVSAFVLDSRFGLDQGFDVYDDFTPQESRAGGPTVPRRDGAETTEAALAWLGERDRAPFFVWVHYYDVHRPITLPSPFGAVADSYDGAVSYVDSLVGRLLEGVERAAGNRETIIIVVADHGEGLGEHDEDTHGAVAYDSTLRVPLIVSGSGFVAGSRSNAFVRTADVAPTILTAAGETASPAFDGRPLQAAHADRGSFFGYFETQLPAYSMGWARIGGVRTERWKYTAEPQPVELYDVLADPGETRNLADEEPAAVARLAAAYARVQNGSEPAVSAASALSPGVREKLHALGYVSSPGVFAPEEVPDPRRVVGVVRPIHDAEIIARQGRVAEAIRLLERAAEDAVARPLALRHLGRFYLATERREDAVQAARDLAAITGKFEDRLEVAGTLVSAGRASEALTEIEAIHASSVEESRRALSERASAYLAAGRFDEAERDARSLLAMDPSSDSALALASRARAARGAPLAEIERLQAELTDREDSARLIETREVLALLLHSQRRDDEAVHVTQGAAFKSPSLRLLLAEIAEQRGDLGQAVEGYAGVLSDLPADRVLSLKLADLYKRVGRHAESLELYDRMIALRPEDPVLYVDRGAVRFALKKRAEAAEDYRKAIAIDPRIPQAHLNLALVFLADGNESEAEESLVRAVELREDYEKAHVYLARLYRGRGDPRAELHAERARRSPARSPSLLVVRSGRRPRP